MFPTNIVVIDSIAIRYYEKNQNKHKKKYFQQMDPNINIHTYLMLKTSLKKDPPLD